MPPGRRRLLIALGVAAGWALAAGALVATAERKIRRLALGGLGESFSTQIYGAPTVIDGPLPRSPQDLMGRLRRLSYVEAAGEPVSAGQYAWADPVLTVGLRGRQWPSGVQTPDVVRFTRGPNGRWTASDMDGGLATGAVLEPELVAELSGPRRVNREPSAWEEFPPLLIAAVVAVEDRRFFTHRGIDPRAVGRALWFNLTNRRALQGGSTITQQLAKNLFLTQKRTLRRKAAEVVLAPYLELRFSKQEILTLYLNQIYMGQAGDTGVAGMKSAARFYFDRDLRDLNLAQSALLAGVIRSPYRYNPFRDPRAARDRRDTVLGLMKDQGVITEEAWAAARREPVPAPRAPDARTGNENLYFVDEVVRGLTAAYGEEAVFRDGLRVYTTLDPALQRRAQSAVRTSRHQAAMVVIDPASGDVLALVGGKDHAASPYNRATQASRQPGSAFKPFVYGAALEKGMTAATLLADVPHSYPRETGAPWVPRNFDRIYHGTVTVRQALAFSMNAATLDLAEKTGIRSVLLFARKMGIQSLLERNWGTILGVSGVSLLEITAAYAPFANGGVRVTPRLVTAVTDAEGNILEENPSERTQVLDPGTAYLMTSLLETAVREGTARSLARLGWTAPAAGKTGTTNEGKDGWFIGYTESLLAGVWSGDDDAKPIGASGAVNALPLWSAFMTGVYRDAPPAEFEEPEGIVATNIDPLSGLLARAGCPNQKKEIFLRGLAPTRYCALHAGGVRGWFQRLFRHDNAPAVLPQP